MWPLLEQVCPWGWALRFSEDQARASGCLSLLPFLEKKTCQHVMVMVSKTDTVRAPQQQYKYLTKLHTYQSIELEHKISGCLVLKVERRLTDWPEVSSEVEGKSLKTRL